MNTIARHPLAASAAPHAALGALVIAGTLNNAAAEYSGAEAEVLLATAAACFVVAVVAAVVAKRRLADRRSRHRAHAFIAASAAWLTTVTACGMSLNAVALIATIGSVLSLHWWREHRIPNPNPTNVVMGGSQPAARPDGRGGEAFIDDWRIHAAKPGRAVPGSTLESPERIESGWRYLLRPVRGQQTLDTVRAAIPQLRGALELWPHEDLIVEQHPLLPEPNLRLTVVTKSPITDTVNWPGPEVYDPRTGCIRLGPHTDGEGYAHWRLLVDNGLHGGYIVGSSGSGKSRLIDGLALGHAAAGCVVWFIDGDEGASSALLTNYADHAGIDDQYAKAKEMLAGALLIMQLRRRENVQHGWDGFTPSADRRPLVIFIDECHLIFAIPELQKMAAEIARRGRKVGVAIVAASQVATLDAFGGSGQAADVLRDSLRRGNTVIMRSLTNNTKIVFGVDIDPTKFPELPGYSYYITPKGSTFGRTAPFRAHFLADSIRDHWAPRLMVHTLSTGDAYAYGDLYLRRKEITERERAEAAAWVAARRGGVLADDDDVSLAAMAPTYGAEVAQFPVWNPTPTPVLTPGQRKVLTAVHNGHTSPAEIAVATGYSESHVHNLLGELRTAGHIAKASYGKYAAA